MITQSTISFQIVLRPELSTAQKQAMFRLLSAHFLGVSPEQFARDLAEKQVVALLERGSELVGFSTMAAYGTSFEDELITVVYSGDTIVDPRAWGRTALPRAWAAWRACAPGQRGPPLMARGPPA